MVSWEQVFMVNEVLFEGWVEIVWSFLFNAIIRMPTNDNINYLS